MMAPMGYMAKIEKLITCAMFAMEVIIAAEALQCSYIKTSNIVDPLR